MKILLIVLAICIGIDTSGETEEEIAGRWSWSHETSDGKCSDTGSIHFRINGQYKRSRMSGCKTFYAKDGFQFSYGWFVEENLICFVNSEEAWNNRVLVDKELQCRIELIRTTSGKLKLYTVSGVGGKKVVIQMYRRN